MPLAPDDPNAWMFNYLGGFARSAAEGIPELVGITPSFETRKWREDNPIGGFVSEFATPLGYYGGALKLGRLGRYGAAVDKIGTNYTPLLGGAVRESVRLAPFELGRVGVSALVGDPERTALDAAVGMGITAGLGGFGAVIEAAGRRLARKWGSTDPQAPIQVQARTLLQKLPELQGEALAAAKQQLRDWRLEIVGREVDRAKGRYVDLLEGAKAEDSRQINRLFRRPEREENRRVRGLFHSPKTGARDTPEELTALLEGARLGPDDVYWMKYPRYVEFGDPKTAGNFKRGIIRGMKKVNEDTFLAKEKEGLYVMGRRLRPEVSPVTGKPRDEWIFWKTDDPMRFATAGEKAWAGKIEARSAWMNAAERTTDRLLAAQDTMGFVGKTLAEFPLRSDLPKDPGKLDKAISALGNAYGLGDAGQMADGFKAMMREYTAPSGHRFKGSPLGDWLAKAAKLVHDYATYQASKFLIGDLKLEPGKSVIGQIARGTGGTGGFRALNAAVKEEERGPLQYLINRGLNLQTPEAAELAPAARKVFETMDLEYGKLAGEVRATEKALGMPLSRMNKNHLLIASTWKGEHRVPLYEGNRVVFMANGTSRGAAMKQAAQVREMAAADGKVWAQGKEFQIASIEDDMKQLRQMSNSQAELNLAAGYAEKIQVASRLRPGAPGASPALVPMTEKELLDAVGGHIQRVRSYLANMAVRHHPDMLKARRQLENSDHSMHRQVVEYFDDLMGKKGPVTTIVNNALDGLLAPVIGGNSATKVVNGFNHFLYRTQLAAGNLAFPVSNLMTFAHTVLPELAFVAHGAPEAKAPYYSLWATARADGTPGKVLGVLDAWKMQFQAGKLLRSPDAGFTQAIERAANEGVIDPRLIYEFIGPQAQVRVKFKDAFSSPSNFARGLDQLSNYLPETTERLSRMHSFAVAHLFGRDFLGMGGDQLYTFAKQFTNRTMFLYNTADRAKIIQGPLGAGFGLFKNWSINYLWNFMDYIGEASRGNFRPLLWGSTGTGIVAGAPATGLLWTAAENMSQWMTGESAMKNWYDAFPRESDGTNWSDALMLGIPGFLPTLAGLPGVSFAASAAQPLSDPTRDISQLMSFVYWDRMKYLGGTLGAAMDAWDNGQNPFQNAAFTGQLARALAPKAIYRVQQSLADGVITSSTTDYPNLQALPMEKGLYMAGFNPTRVELGYRAFRELYNDEQAMAGRVSALGAAWAQAQQAGDSRAVKEIVQQVVLEGIDMDRVMRSMTARMQNQRDDMFQRNFSQEKLASLTRAGLYNGPQ